MIEEAYYRMALLSIILLSYRQLVRRRTFLSHGGRIKYRQVENRQFFRSHVFNAPAIGVPLGIGYRQRGQKLKFGLSDGQKVLR